MPIKAHTSNPCPLRVAIIGCGKIADQHVQAIHRVPNCQIVALCDREILMAKQLAERFHVPACFSDAEEMLRQTKPEVVHITTPPQSHFGLGRLCLEAGSHIYLEKPFTVTADEAAILVQSAQKRNLRMTAGHNYQFTLEMMRMRRLVRNGFLGGRPVHLESYWPYDLSDASYAAALLGNRNHWVRRLPGQLLHNIISHGIARLAEFLDDQVEVTAQAQQGERLHALGENEILDELRVLLRDSRGTTAFFCFSSQMKPGLNQFRIYGPRNSIIVDLVSGSLLRLRSRSFKSYLTYFAPPLIQSWEHFRNAAANIANFLRRRLYQDAGMKELIERFYLSIRLSAEPPIPYREIVLTARIMDTVFAQVYPSTATQLTESLASPSASPPPNSSPRKAASSTSAF